MNYLLKICLMAFFVLMPMILWAAPGDIDTSFARISSKQSTAIGVGGEDESKASAIQSDGKIVVVGYSINATADMDFALVRYNQDGTLDTTFGGDGKVTKGFYHGNDIAYDVAIQSDGKIVVVGEMDGGSHRGICIIRYNSDGTLDTSFNGGLGYVERTDSTHDLIGVGVAIQSDGKIVVAATIYYDGGLSDSDIFIARYLSNGIPDEAFGIGGDGANSSNVERLDHATDVALQSNGKIIVSGYSEVGSVSEFLVLRYDTDGILDTTFDSDGYVMSSLAINSSNNFARSVAIQTDGKIIVAGKTVLNGNIARFAVIRYNINGSYDNTFDGDGKVVTAIGDSEEAYGMAIQSDGKIILGGGSSRSTGNVEFAVVRYNTNGSLDTTFDGDGKMTSESYGSNDFINDIAIQNDGKIIAVGVNRSGSNDRFAIERYLGSGSISPAIIYYLLN